MLTVAISSRALFNLEDGNAIFHTDGVAAFDAYMRENETKELRPGVAFSVVKMRLALNTPGLRDRVEVILLSECWKPARAS
jgi:5'-nucleotidase